MLNKGQKNTSIENVVGFPTFGTVLAYQKLYGTEDGAGVLAETTAHLSSPSLNVPLVEAAITSPTAIHTVRVMNLERIAPFSHRNLKGLVKELANRIAKVSKRLSIDLDLGDEKVSIEDVFKTFTKGQLRSVIAQITSGEILGNFVVSFVLSSALQEIISESFMLDTKIKLRGELVAELQKQQSAQADVSNLLYYDINDIIQIYADDYQPTDPVELERLMGPQEVYRAFLLSTMK